MPNLIAYGTIKEGKLTLANRKRFEADLRGFKDGAVELTIRKKNRRSSQANRYYWGVVVKEIEIRMRELGNDVDSEIVHAFLKDRFNKIEVIGEGGEVIDYLGASTANLNKEAFSQYIEKIMQWSSEFLGLNIPAANTDLQFQF